MFCISFPCHDQRVHPLRETGALRRERCDRCLRRTAVDELADAGDPAAVATLAPFLDWMAAARNPASMLRWIRPRRSGSPAT
jgi:hypothetical protein